ncbi:MAG: glycosyltransferase family 2 protein [Acidobacteriota bacterium]|nr:glycosyltransferase family 2 protein [Acidobacteriota bacterium]
MQVIETHNRIEKYVGAKVIKTTPKISIITPAYKIAEYIAETLDSVFAQTFEDYEIIVNNDGSPDTPEFERVLQPYLDKIVYLKQSNEGAAAARNVAIEHARGDLLAFLDGDDVWQQNFLQSQIEFLEANDLDLVYSDAILFGGSAMDGQLFTKNAPSTGAVNFESLLDLRCNIITSGVLTKKRSVLEAGKFDADWLRAHDFALWLKMARNQTRIGYQKQVLLKYRVRPDSLSGNSMQRVERELDSYRRVKKQFALDDAEKRIVETQLTRLGAELEIERGKSFLLNEDFAAARTAFGKANEYRRSNRLRAIIFLIKFAPRSLLKFYRLRRPTEIDFAAEKRPTADKIAR